MSTRDAFIFPSCKGRVVECVSWFSYYWFCITWRAASVAFSNKWPQTHHRVARPWQDIAVSTSFRHLERSCARFHAELKPRLCCWRSSSIVRSQVCLGRPGGRCQSTGRRLMANNVYPSPGGDGKTKNYQWAYTIKSSGVTYHTEEYIGRGVERFGSCGCHGKLHHPRQFSDDALHNSPVEQNGHHWTEKYYHWQHLRINTASWYIGWHDRSWTILNDKLTMLELLNIY